MENRTLFIRIPKVVWSRVNHSEYKIVTEMWINVGLISAFTPSTHRTINGEEFQVVIIDVMGLDYNIEILMNIDEFTELLINAADNGIIH